jgi:hypothetical protein
VGAGVAGVVDVVGVVTGGVMAGPGRGPPATMGAGREEAQAASVMTAAIVVIGQRMARVIIRVSETKSERGKRPTDKAM